ncbi:MAG: hypothetical protein GY774_10025 [Planctomycetes bacterium]|nr:hypothetical protein [Planctomycetota bacterium]
MKDNSQKDNNNIVKKSETSLSQDYINQAFGGSELQIPRGAKLPTISIVRETAQFEMPDGSLANTFVSHIVHWHYTNMYYSTLYGEGDPNPPDCTSSDGIQPDGGTNPQPGPCMSCPLNKIQKTADGYEPKLCTNNIWLYVLVEDEVIPCVLKAPPSSLNPKESLMCWLTQAPNLASKVGLGISYQPIKVEFSLAKKTFRSGRSASVINLTTIRPLNPSDPIDKTTFEKLNNLWQGLKKHYFGQIRNAVSQNLSVGETTNDKLEVGHEETVDDDGELDNSGEPNPDWVGNNPSPPDDDLKF